MNYIDISAYQKTHYKELCRIIFEFCSVFRIIDPYGDFDIEQLEIFPYFIGVKRSNQWDRTKSKGKEAYIYSFALNKESRIFFERQDSFFRTDRDNAICNTAIEGQYDYSFIDKDTENSVLSVTTHEGSVFLREDIYRRCFERLLTHPFLLQCSIP